jgi:hypothetical protein
VADVPYVLQPIRPSSVSVLQGSISIKENNAVEAVSATRIRLNDVFSDDYENYLISFSGFYNGSSDGSALEFNFIQPNGTIEFGNEYFIQALWGRSGGFSAGRSQNTYSARWGSLGLGTNNGANILISYPYQSYATCTRTITVNGYTNAAVEDYTNVLATFQPYSGIIFYPLGALTATISVFGINQ